MQKNMTIQAFRAFAIFAVVLIHVTPQGEWQVWFRPFVNFAVPCFLFLSGYLTRLEYPSWSKFYVKRIFRVLIPYFIWTTIYCLPILTDNFTQGLGIYLYDLATAEGNYVLYYIFVYIQLVLLTPLLIKLTKSKWSGIGYITPPIYLLVIKYLPTIAGYNSLALQLINSDCCLYLLAFYYMGLMLGNDIICNTFKIRQLLILYIFSLLIQMIEGYLWYSNGYENPGSNAKLSCLISGMIAMLMVDFAIKNNVFANINGLIKAFALYSFGIYLCHPLIMDYEGWIGHLYNNRFFILKGIITLFVSLSFCWVIAKIFGRKVSRILGLE